MRLTIIGLVVILISCSNIGFANNEPISVPNRTLIAYCGVPWGASQQATKDAMTTMPFNATLQIEDNEILVYSGIFGGETAEFAFSFTKNKLVGGLIFIYDNPEDTSRFNRVKETLITRHGEPNIVKPDLTWAFLSSYKPLPDYAFIKLFKSTGSMIGKDRKTRPVIVLMSFDHDLKQQYEKARSKD